MKSQEPEQRATVGLRDISETIVGTRARTEATVSPRDRSETEERSKIRFETEKTKANVKTNCELLAKNLISYLKIKTTKRVIFLYLNISFN